MFEGAYHHKAIALEMKTLRECLIDYDTMLLRAIAERLGVELTTSQQHGMVEEIAVALLEVDLVTEILTWLSDEERQAIDTLVANNGRMRAYRFALRFGEIRRFGPGSMVREAPWRAPVSPAEGLWYRGLIARGFAEETGTVVEFVFIPSDLLHLLPPAQADQKPFVVPQAGEPHRVALGDPASIDDVCTLLAAIQDRTLAMQEEQLTSESIEHLTGRFLCNDRARVSFLYHVARSAGFVQVEGRTLHLNREPVRSWLRLSRARQLQMLQGAWFEDAGWNDLRHVPGIRCEDTGWRNDPLLPRKTVLRLLPRCQADAWLSISGFVDAVRERFPDYARPDGDFESWYIRDARSGEYLMGFEHWDQIEGALLVHLLSGPLHWLGLVSLGYKEGWEKPSAFRITPWGMAYAGLPHAPLEALPPQPASVAPDGTVTLLREAPLSDRYQLARIADWRASGAEYAYTITPASLGRALSAGIQVERVERFLRRISEDSVPAAAVARIRSWAGRYGHVRLHRTAILETRTPQLMSDLRAHERIRGYLRQALSPTIALVRESDWEVLTEELHRAGYLPEIIER